MDLEHFAKKRIVRGRNVTVVVVPMNKDQAREMFPYRPLNRYAESRFGGDIMTDDIVLLLNSDAERCSMCEAPTRVKYLAEGYCPDCDGRSEFNGEDPRSK